MIQIAVFAYVFIQLVFGVIYSKRIANSEDFIVGGRRMGAGLASFTIFATWFGAEAIVGTGTEVYKHGLAGAASDPFGYVFALLLMGFGFAKIIRARGLLTLGDLFKEEYGGRVEKLATLLIMPGPIFWGAAQISAFGTTLSELTSTSYTLGISIATATVIIYTTMGGFQASAVTDLFQSIILMLGLVVLNIFFFREVGWNQVSPERLTLSSGGDESWWMSIDDWAVPIFGTIVAVELISRLLACRSPEVASKSSIMGGMMYLIFGLLPVTIGLYAPAVVTETVNPDAVIQVVAERFLILPDLFFPPLLYVLFIGALISAILSTVDSVLLSGASLLSNNLVNKVLRLDNLRAQLVSTRLCVVLLGLIAFGLALGGSGVKDLVEIASSIGSSGLFPVFCFALFTTWGGELSAIASLSMGMISWLTLSSFDVPAPYFCSIILSTIMYLLVAFGLGEQRAKSIA